MVDLEGMDVKNSRDWGNILGHSKPWVLEKPLFAFKQKKNPYYFATGLLRLYFTPQ